MGKSGKKKTASGLMQQVQQTARAARTALAARLLANGLYAGQDQILLALADSAGLTPGALAQALGVRPPTITKTINRLQAQGFLEKSASETDGRQAVIRLTEKGESAIEAVRKSVRRTEKRALKGLDKKELKSLTKALFRIEANLAALAADKETGDAPDVDEDEETETPDTAPAKASAKPGKKGASDGLDVSAVNPEPGGGEDIHTGSD